MEKLLKKILHSKMTFWRHVIEIRKIALERQNGAQSNAQELKDARKILKNCLSKSGHFGVLGLNFEIRVNHTIFESS